MKHVITSMFLLVFATAVFSLISNNNFRQVKILILLFFASFQLQAQKTGPASHSMYSLTLSIDHISYPGNKKYRPKHIEYPRHSLHTGWGISAGVDIPFSKNSSNHFQWSQSFRAGYLNNPGIQHAFRLYTEPTLLYKLSIENSQMLQTGLQLGYMRVYPKGGMISRQQEKTHINRNGRGQFTGGFMLGGGYRFQNESAELQNSLQYHFWVQGPFIPGRAPLLPHQSFSFSSSFHL
ncbi:MAG TPA: hypothetical protein VGQ04_21950 [Chitinophagaceae bacterium]|jgi:hypothetical protein|nr:hypothetical protein [Chitinophagaceae bacterium]